MSKTFYKKDLIYPELSYIIVGCAFQVYNEIGGGHRESVYQKALGIALKNSGLDFKEQKFYAIKFNGEVVGRGIFDFFVEEKIVVELKAKGFFSLAHYDQVLGYLKENKLKLGLLLRFGHDQVVSKRVVNFNILDNS